MIMALRQPKHSDKSARVIPYPAKSTSQIEHPAKTTSQAEQHPAKSTSPTQHPAKTTSGTEHPAESLSSESGGLEAFVVQNQIESKELDHTDGKSYPCISARQPYAGFMLNGYKTLETRWTPMFKELENQTVAIHIAQRTWEGSEWREAFHLRGMSDAQIECLAEDAEGCDRGMIAGLIDIGETWQCTTPACSSKQRAEWEKDALLRPLEEKYLTKLANPRWLKTPIRSRGQKGVWTVRLKDEHEGRT